MALYDGDQMRLLHYLAPPKSSSEDNTKAFALLTGAAAAAAARFSDVVDLGADLTPLQRRHWASLTSLLMEIADSRTPDGHLEGPRRVSLLGTVLLAGSVPLADPVDD
jgi:hypothetical protein